MNRAALGAPSVLCGNRIHGQHGSGARVSYSIQYGQHIDAEGSPRVENLEMHNLIRVHRTLLDAQLDLLRGAEGLMRDAVTRYEAEVESWYAKQKTASEGPAPDYLLELYSEQKTDALDGYPQLLRAALFAIAYGELEQFLNRICHQDSRQRASVNLSDLRDEGIRRAKLYLAKVAKLDFPATPEWQDLTNYGRLRNVLVHAQGEVPRNDKLQAIQQLQKRVGTFEVLTAGDRKRVVLRGGFLSGFVLTAETFSQQLEAAANGSGSL